MATDLIRRFIFSAANKGFLLIALYKYGFYFISRSVGPAIVQIRHFILRSPGAIWTLWLDSKIGYIIKKTASYGNIIFSQKQIVFRNLLTNTQTF